VTKNLSEGHEALYQMICSLKSEDIHKVVSYVSFLRFVDVYKDKGMADLLRIEIAQDDLNSSFNPQNSFDSQDSFHSQYPSHSQDAFHSAGNYTDDSIELPAHKLPDVEVVYEAENYKDGKYDMFNYAKYDDKYGKERSADETLLNKEPEPAYDISVVEISHNEPVLTEEAPPPNAPLPEETLPPEEALSSEEALPPIPSPKPNISMQKLRWVAKSLNLNFKDMAFLFNISPSMARMRYMGTELLSVEEEMQLQFFLEMAERVENMGISRFDRLLRYPMPDGEFFLEKLKDRKVTGECLTILQKTAENFDELRRKFKGATKPFHAMQDAIGAYATPLHCEG